MNSIQPRLVRHLLAVALAVTTAAGALVGCSSDSNSGTAADRAAASTTSAPADDPATTVTAECIDLVSTYSLALIKEGEERTKLTGLLGERFSADIAALGSLAETDPAQKDRIAKARESIQAEVKRRCPANFADGSTGSGPTTSQP